MSGDLVAFLTARLAEDEAAALAAGSGEWVALDGGVMSVSDETWPVASTEVERDREVRVHIARHDPARVLREAEARRRLISRYQMALSQRDGEVDLRLAALYGQMRDEAAVYSGHPDYDENWKP